MFSFKKKIDTTLLSLLYNNPNRIFRVLIKCKNLQDNISKRILSYKGEVIHSINECNIICARIPSKHIQRLAEYPEVDYICLDEYAFLCGMSVRTANKSTFPVNFDQTGSGIGIGIIDSGVFPHPDLTLPINKIKFFKDIINTLNYPYDDNGHGTSICGILSSSGDISKGLYKGIAPNASLCVIKAFDKLGKGFASDILASILILLSHQEEFNIKVLCLPFEFFNCPPIIFEAFENILTIITESCITPIIPSGSNKNIDSSITGLALSKKCITVSGLDTNTTPITPYSYSSCGDCKNITKPDLSAACSDIVSLNSDTNYISEKNGIRLYPHKLKTSYQTYSGTSLAAAYVAGICALLYENNMNLTFKDVYSLLKLSCTSLDIPKNQQGNGIIRIKNLFIK